MDYPRDFSKQAQANVEAANIRAEQVFDETVDRARTNSDRVPYKFIETALEQYILSAFAVFAHECCEIGKSGAWTASRVDEEAQEFLRIIANQAHFYKGFNIHGGRLESMHSHINGSLKDDVRRRFMESPEWKKYRAERLVVADIQRTPRAFPETGESVLHGASRTSIKSTAASMKRVPARAAWLKDRLSERAWNASDPHRQRGPDRKTIQKILRGEAVRDDVLEKLANALSKKFAKVELLDIPQN
jgi:hypothetical protein